MCCPGDWELSIHTTTYTKGLFRISFIKKTEIIFSYNHGFFSIYVINNHIFNKLYNEYGLSIKYLNFNQIR
jgi:hypothetical protein